MNTLCLIGIVFCFIALLYLTAIMSKVNDIHETETEEPLGDMVDVRAIIKKYSED